MNDSDRIQDREQEFVPPLPLRTPVLLLVFNRPDATRQVMDTLRISKPPRLYVAADGSRPGLNEASAWTSSVPSPSSPMARKRRSARAVTRAASDAGLRATSRQFSNRILRRLLVSNGAESAVVSAT
jgi:hypothetical protein